MRSSIWPKAAKFPVIILLGGVDGAGRGETVNLLNEWMDPRHVQSHGMGEPSDEELDRPMMWRFWRALPPKGKIGVFLGSWYTWPILNRVTGVTKTADLDQSLERAKRLEKMLTDEGALIIKFWLHLSKEKQEKRLKMLEKDPKTRWRVTERDWEHFKLYDKFRTVHESVIRHTSTAEAPWFIVEGEDPRYRSLTIGKMILEAIRKRLDVATRSNRLESMRRLCCRRSISLHILKTLDLTQKIEKKKYEEELEKYQGKLALLTRDPRFREITVIAGVRGQRCGRQGRQHPPHHQRAGCAAFTRSCRLPRRPRKSAPSPICGASGAICRGAGESRFSTAPGMAGCWWSGSRAFARKPTGCAPTAKSTISRRSWRATTSW